MRTSSTMRRVGAPLLIALAALLLASVLLTSSGQAKSPPSAVKPTIVLVHGAWADSSSWDGEISRLQADGYPCLLYTSDAADEEDSVDLGGRRIIKKKKK